MHGAFIALIVITNQPFQCFQPQNQDWWWEMNKQNAFLLYPLRLRTTELPGSKWQHFLDASVFITLQQGQSVH